MIEVKYVDHMGTDLSVVNAAKVSFGARSEWKYEDYIIWSGPSLSKKDQSLISFLARGCTSGEWGNHLECLRGGWMRDEEFEGLINHIKKMPAHWSPFAHTAISMNIKMPIFVARQIMKHTTGIEFNEISRRYVNSEPEFFVPNVWREKADNVKQGSSNEAVRETPDGFSVAAEVRSLNKHSFDLYKEMLISGVAPEQARMVLPQSMMTEVVMTGNLYALSNLYNQRIDPHAQYESQLVAKGVGDILSDLFPYSFKELTK